MKTNVRRGAKTGPGKFEVSGELGEYLYELTMESGQDDELGDAENFGWYGLFDGVKIPGIRKKVYAIVSEDSQGFFDVSEYDNHAKLTDAWGKLQMEYDELMEEIEEEY